MNEEIEYGNRTASRLPLLDLLEVIRSLENNDREEQYLEQLWGHMNLLKTYGSPSSISASKDSRSPFRMVMSVQPFRVAFC